MPLLLTWPPCGGPYLVAAHWAEARMQEASADAETCMDLQAY